MVAGFLGLDDQPIDQFLAGADLGHGFHHDLLAVRLRLGGWIDFDDAQLGGQLSGNLHVGSCFEPIVCDADQVAGFSAHFNGIALIGDRKLQIGDSFDQRGVIVAGGQVEVAMPFDMEFLRRVEGQLGLTFDMPVLDTVLLSAVVYGQHEVHSLDALSHRLGITIPEEARHTALGDTLATADAFLKLMPMLTGRGLDTFGAVLTEVRKHGRLLKDLN